MPLEPQDRTGSEAPRAVLVQRVPSESPARSASPARPDPRPPDPPDPPEKSANPALSDPPVSWVPPEALASVVSADPPVGLVPTAVPVCPATLGSAESRAAQERRARPGP